MARFRFKAVAPSSEVVEGELEALDRQAAIGRLRELNHLPVRVEELRDSPFRRRERAERVEPVMAEPPRIETDRAEPMLTPPAAAEPAESPAVEATPPPALRTPIVRLRDVLRGTVGLGREKTRVAPILTAVPAPSAAEPPPAPEPEPEPLLAPEPPAEPQSVDQDVAEALSPSAEEAAAAAPAAQAEFEPGAFAAETALPGAAPEGDREIREDRLPEVSLEPLRETEPLPLEPTSLGSTSVEPAPADAAPPQPDTFDLVARVDEPYPPPRPDAAGSDEPLPIRWDVTPAEPAPPPVDAEAPAESAGDDSSAERWLAEFEQRYRERDQPTGEAPDREPRLEPAGRAVVPAAAALPPMPVDDLAVERETEPEPVHVEAPQPPVDERRKAKPKRTRRALPARLLPVFTRELQVLLSAGLPMDQALRIIVESTADDRVAAAADALLARVRGGALLSEAMEALPEQFDEFLRTAVRAGEAGGSLAEVLDQVAAYQERGQRLERSVRTALIYPTILACAAALSVTLLLTLVVPQFEALLRQSAQVPPLATRVVIAASIYVRAYGWIVPAVAVVLWLLGRWRFGGLRSRTRLHARLLRLPLIGKVLAGVSVERLARALGTLLANGVPLPEALPLVASAVPNRAIGAVVASAAERVKQGERLADAIEDRRILPSLAVQLIRVGEEGGRLSAMLARVAEIYAGDVDVAVRRVTAVIEPALILVIGVVVGGIVLSLLAAITGLNTLAL